jgi:hypothetical protein
LQNEYFSRPVRHVSMKPLSPDELARYDRRFRIEARLVTSGRQIAKQIELELNRGFKEPECAKVLEALAHDLVRNLRMYSVRADLSYTAWITRNILELDTALTFVTSSRDNLATFMDDIILDEIELRQAAFELNLDRADPEIASRQDEALERLQRQANERGLTRKRPISGQKMASAISQSHSSEYKRLNKFYSKVVHPTAYRLMGGEFESTDWGAYKIRVLMHGVDRASDFRARLLREVFGAGPAASD